LEISIANTRKGIKNQFKNLWKKNERGENDGLKDNFKMNKEELELRNLVDLAMVSQDYETAYSNGKIPFSDFKKCKASRHAASCQEVIAFAGLGFEQIGFS
jgi:HEPN domain-containing protein